ncbi:MULTISPECIES: phage tail sheath subtilisin-like domain-containing protein [unclassified Mycobacterium]|uniref:phage tail sheath family protein n=1 Tax=unclassified Mycobacterium TaxID=2642494 RepID=UPI0004900212|nr:MULTISPECIES: phage tail sheath subtilisin-like domain-containing protein [unclassified Mycobacterium]SEB02421.1 hypothetical protein SAMN04488580_10694 [Mycobacterium sp. 283mftsu]
MAVQVSWPGVYIDEFEPGAPIQGVGTSTPVFLGIAERGPRNTPTRIFSWDEFVTTFGGFLPDRGAWLAQSVFGFFTNGGTNCYVVRVSTAAMGTVDLPFRGGGGNAVTATAIAEGPEGNAIKLTVRDTSRSKAVMKQLMSRGIAAMVDRKNFKLTGGVANYNPNDTITVTNGTEIQSGDIDTVTAPDMIKLKADLAGNTDFTGGTVYRDTVRVLSQTKGVNTVSADRLTLTLADAQHSFAIGDAVTVVKGGNSADATLRDVAGAILTLAAPLGGNFDFNASNVRMANLGVNTKRIRLVTPKGLSLTTAFPRGSLLEVKPQGGGAATYLRVAGSGGDEVQLDSGLPATIALPDNPAQAPEVSTADFDLVVQAPAATRVETFTYLSMDARSPGYWGTAVRSNAVSLAAAKPLGTPATGDDRPLAGDRTTAGGVADDRASSWQSLTTTPAQYLNPLARLRDVSLIAVPGGTTPEVQQALIAHCELLKDRFAVLDARRTEDGSSDDLGITGVMNQFAQVRSADGYAALYYPWIQVRHPATGALELWPPSGHILGVCARTDADRGVHKAPANTNIRGALGVQKVLSDQEQGPLNLLGVNVLRVFPGQSQPQVWGARTTAGDLDTNWLYVNIRRLFIYLEQSLERGIRWAVFEPNDLELWQKLKRSISDFLTQAWRDGALFGAKPEDAFYVRIDEVLNPPATRALGRLYIEIGVVPTYPAEFIILRIGIWDGGGEITTA